MRQFYTGISQLFSASGNAYGLYQDLDIPYLSVLGEGPGMKLGSLNCCGKASLPNMIKKYSIVALVVILCSDILGYVISIPMALAKAVLVVGMIMVFLTAVKYTS